MQYRITETFRISTIKSSGTLFGPTLNQQQKGIKYVQFITTFESRSHPHHPKVINTFRVLDDLEKELEKIPTSTVGGKIVKGTGNSFSIIA